jgi:dolichol-phosphate mannosyltransferase
VTAVTVVLPTYNESQTITTAINRVQAAAPDDHQVLVVDDNSPDGTAKLVRDEFDDDRVQCLVRTEETGLSSAIIRGLDAANGSSRVVMDADLQHPPERVPDLVEAVEAGADIAIGTRFGAGGCIPAWPAHRRLISRGAAWLARWQIPAARQITDPMTGFFAVDGSLIDNRTAQLHPDGYKALLEIMARCPVEDVDEVGFEFSERVAGESKLTPLEYLRFARHLTRASVPAREEAVNE